MEHKNDWKFVNCFEKHKEMNKKRALQRASKISASRYMDDETTHQKLSQKSLQFNKNEKSNTSLWSVGVKLPVYEWEITHKKMSAKSL